MYKRLLVSCVAVCSAACSGSGAVLSTADAGSFCSTISKMALDKEAECFRFAPAVVDSWSAGVTESCAALQHEVDTGRAVYDAALGSSCAHRVAALDGCSAYSAMMDPSADCNTALRGAVPVAGACWSYADCADGLCATSADGCSGQCVPYAREGQPCTTPCAPGLSCGWDLTGAQPAGICMALSDVDGPCPCKQGLYCDYQLDGVAGASSATPTCKPLLRNGFCNGTDQCAPGFSCSGSPSACVPLAGAGAGCGVAQCGWGFYCDSATSACAVLPDLGQSCVLSRNGTTAELQCVRGRCDAGGTKTCVALKEDGEACTSSDECAHYDCDPSQQRCVGGGYVPPVCTPP